MQATRFEYYKLKNPGKLTRKTHNIIVVQMAAISHKALIMKDDFQFRYKICTRFFQTLTQLLRFEAGTGIF